VSNEPDISDPVSRRLFADGFSELERRFDPNAGLVWVDGNDSLHDLRDSLWYALCLLLRGAPEPAEVIISRVLGTQVTDPNDHHRGNFRWFYEVEPVSDLNAVEFILERLVNILCSSSDRISFQSRSLIHNSMRLGFDEVRRLDVHWTYTNIFLLDVHNSILGGQLLGDAALLQRGVARLKDWFERTRSAGAPHEFNSPTYSAVQIIALAGIARFAEDADVRGLAKEAEKFLWIHVARHFHAPTRQLAGPHSRAYRRDVTGSVGFLKVLLYKVLGDERLLASTPYYSGPGREGDVIVSLTNFNPPPEALDMLRLTEEREVIETASPDQVLTTYLRPEFALGTMSREYSVGEPPEPWAQQNSCYLTYRKGEPQGYGVVYCRYLVNERRAGDSPYASSGTPVDLWDDGLFRTAQSGRVAIVAYGTLPHGRRPVHSLRLDIRMLGPDSGSTILLGVDAWDGSEATLDAGQCLTVSDGDVHIGIIPLTTDCLNPHAPVVLGRDGPELVLSAYNYHGPPKTFWEYRSLSGPFYNRNVLNGFIVVAEPRSNRPSTEFARLLQSASVDDRLDGVQRRITCDSVFGHVALVFDLRRLRL